MTVSAPSVALIRSTANALTTIIRTAIIQTIHWLQVRTGPSMAPDITDTSVHFRESVSKRPSPSFLPIKEISLFRTSQSVRHSTLKQTLTLKRKLASDDVDNMERLVQCLEREKVLWE